MNLTAEYAVAFMAGLVGSVHCLGMCGGFAIAAGSAGNFKRAVKQQAGYHAGKTTTYALLGAVAGTAGGLFSTLMSSQQILALLAGGLLVVFGLGLLGWLPILDRLVRGVSFAPLIRLLRSFLPPSSTRTAFGLGLFNGLLPCGLVYAVVIAAAGTGSALRGALFMSVFGLGTVPALLALGLAGRAIAPAVIRRVSRAGGVLVIALGLLTMVRSGALPGLGTVHSGHGTESVDMEADPQHHSHSSERSEAE